MIDWASVYTNSSGAFPNVLGINASGPGTTDGTEYVAAGINNGYQAFSQNILDYAGLTPDAVSEATGPGQIIEAMQLGFAVGPGVLVGWFIDDDPSVTGHRVLLLQGQGILHASYADLTTLVYVGDAANAAVAAGGGKFYKSTDAAGVTANTAGTYLQLPEARGYALRGLDTAASVDPLGAARFLGDNQVDAFQGFARLSGIATSVSTPTQGVYHPASTTGMPGNATTVITSTPGVPSHQYVGNGIITDGVNGTPRTSSESRMSNMAIQFGITY